MGAWGPGPFDNDDALDWIDDLIESGINALGATLEIAADGDTLEAPDASMALAAAEVVAALYGSPARELPGEVIEWVADYGRALPDELAPLARKAAERVRRESELKDLWEESDPAGWYAAVDDLLRRLPA